MEIMRKIAIFGFGHLAKYLPELIPDAQLTVTVRDTSKVNTGLNLEVVEYFLGNSIPDKLSKSYDVIIWTIPPNKQYLKTLMLADSFFTEQTAWIFISSTSVYKSGDITEKSPLNGDSDNAKILIEIEQFLTQLKRPVSVLRPGGLVDEYRHPARFLSQKLHIDGGDEPVNLVHTKDVVRFIKHLIDYPKHINTDYNLVSDTHLNKEDYYSPFIKNYFGKKPTFITNATKFKIICNDKSKLIKFDYMYPEVSIEYLKLFLS